MPLVWVTGSSGVGKSTACALLKRRGERAVDADGEGYSHWVDRISGLVVDEPPDPLPGGWLGRYAWKLDRAKVEALAATTSAELVFLCGLVENEADVWDLFALVICLVVANETLRKRLESRTTNPFGEHPEELAAALSWNDGASATHRQLGATIIDGSWPPDQVVEAILMAAQNERRLVGHEMPNSPFPNLAADNGPLADLFGSAGCTGALHVRRLSDGSEVGLREEELWLSASIIKVPIGLEFYSQVEKGIVDPRLSVTLRPARRTPGPTGISIAVHPVTMSAWDLCTAMLTVSDNAASDAVLQLVGKDAVNARLQNLGCTSSVLVESIGDSLDSFSNELGFKTYSELLRAQAGELGALAQTLSLDQERIGATRILDPHQANRITAREMTALLAAVWADQAGPPGACASLRRVMGQQVTRRLGGAVPEGGSLAAKSGGLFGRVRNEIAVISDPGGESYAVAVLTRLHRPFKGVATVDDAMRRAVRVGIDILRGERTR